MALTQATMAAIRYGYGLTPTTETPSTGAALDMLINQVTEASRTAPMFPLEGVEARRQVIADYFRLRKDLDDMVKAGKADGALTKALNRELYQRFSVDASARIAQAVTSPHGFYERLAGFWLNHFTVSADKNSEMKVIVPLFEAEAIRPHLGGHFSTLLKEVSLHPAMLIFLDQAQSIGPNSKVGLKRKEGGSNENFAREVMELHTLGVNSGYSQTDVRQLSLLLTGLTFDRLAVAAGFDVNRAEPGRFTVLGKTYDRSPEPFVNAIAVLDDLARDERTMRHVSRQLYSHFIGEQPNETVIASMVAAWKASDGHLPDVYRAMLMSPQAWDGPGAKFKLPFDYVVSTLRAMGVTAADIMGEDAKPRGPMVMPQPDPEDMVGTTGIAGGAMAGGAMAGPAAAGGMMGSSAAPGTGAAMAGDAMAGGAMAAGGMAGGGMAGGGESQVGPAKPAAPLANQAGSAVTPGASASKTATATATAPKPVQPRQPLGRQAEQMIATLGQPIWRPSDAAGFSDLSDHWFSASQLAQRIQWARRLVNQVSMKQDPRQFASATLADFARDDTIRVATQSPNRQSGLVMTLVSPEFNRR